MKMSTKLRESLTRKEMVICISVFNPLTARIAEDTGFFKCLSVEGSMVEHMTGVYGCVAGASDYVNFARPIIDSVSTPVIAEASTGFGNALHAEFTVEKYIKAGLSGLHVEDQVFPKRAEYSADVKYISPMKEVVHRYRAMARARDKFDKDFVLIFRTDANAAVGGSLEETIKRAKAYAGAGADVLLTYPKTIEEMKIIRDEVWKEYPDVALHYSGAWWGTGPANGLRARMTTEQHPVLSFKQAEEMGYRWYNLIAPLFLVTARAVRDILREIKEKGAVPDMPWSKEIADYIAQLTGINERIETERKEEKELGLPKTIWKPGME